MKTEQKTHDDSIEMGDKINDVEMIKRKFMVLFCFVLFLFRFHRSTFPFCFKFLK